jgi:hypothetical protein
MGNNVSMGLRKIEEVNLEGTGRYKLGPWFQIYAWDDNSECGEYVGERFGGSDYTDYIKTTLTDPAQALLWLREHEGEYDALYSFALEYGMYIMDDWYDPEDLKTALKQLEESEDESDE